MRTTPPERASFVKMRCATAGPCSPKLESKQVLAAYGIPAVETAVAASEDDSHREAARIGYPVVLKLHSETITHKTDVGGVQLNLSIRRSRAPAHFETIRDVRFSVPRIFSASPSSPWCKLEATN